MAAVVAGDEARVRKLLQSGASVREEATSGPFLQESASAGDESALRGGVIAISWQPLHVAAWLGHVEIAGLLLLAGADPNAPTPQKWRPVLAAASQGHLPLVELLVAHGADPDVLEETLGAPLEVASFQGHDDVVRFLLVQGADLNRTRRNGRSPLIAAVIGGRDTVARELIACGANPLHADDKQWTGRMHAVWYTRYGLASALSKPGLSLHLADAAASGDLVQIGVHLAAGSPVDQPDGYGDSPLVWACRGGHRAAVERLLDAGASLRAEGLGGDPIEAAAERGHLAVVEMLLARGADPQIALSPAAQAGQMEIVRLLVRAGASADAKALIDSVKAEQLESVRLLIELGASVNQRNEAGFTGLHCAAYSGNTDVVALLLAQGADPSIAAQDDRTAAQIAEEAGWDELVALLKR